MWKSYSLTPLMAAVGANLFVLSDAVLAVQRFHHPFSGGRINLLGTYFAAQGGIVLSVVLHHTRPRFETQNAVLSRSDQGRPDPRQVSGKCQS